jgi:hypothetical protein
MKLIPTQYSHYVFSFFMSLLMSGIMSGCITIFNLGWIADLWQIWLQAWAGAFVIAFPTIVLITPLVRRLVLAVVKPTPAQV